MLNESITFFTATLPLSELRGAIPLAILKFGFNPYKAFVLGVFGNILPILPLLFGLEKISEYLSRKFYWFNKFFSWLFERTRIKHTEHFACWKNWALFMFVAIPLPLTGAYSGVAAAFVFGISKTHAFWSIVLGVLAAGLIVTGMTVFGENIFKYLFLL
ncbi:MAG: small multi-drug export protein [Patescibacteria group bacterium]